jgi:hypothetical protein
VFVTILKLVVFRNNCLTFFVNADSSTTIGSRGFMIRILLSFDIITHTRYSIGDIMPGKGYKPKKAMKKNKVKKRK